MNTGPILKLMAGERDGGRRLSGITCVRAPRLLRPSGAFFRLAFGALLVIPASAQAAELVSNIGQDNSSTIVLATNEMAMGFETGPTPGGYTLGSIEVEFVTASNVALQSVTATLWTADEDDSDIPGSSIATLSNPASLSEEGVGTFSAPPNTTLSASTDYFVHLSYSGNIQIFVQRTRSDDEDDTSADGWSIHGDRLWRARGSNNAWVTSGHLLKIRVNDDTAPPPAQTQTEVPADWSLIPSGLSAGDDFRLLIVTSTQQTAENTDIVHYNTVVQGDVSGNGHTDIQGYSAKFNMLGCTETTSASANTNTASTDTAAPIYWLNGAKVADDYADLYDGSWDSNAPKYPAGTDAPTIGLASVAFTGCGDTGVVRALGYLGSTDADVNVGYPGNAGFEFSNVSFPRTDSYRFYGLSEIFRVAGASASTDATLSALSLGTGVTLDPAFASATTEYRAWVANPVDSVTVTATKNDEAATVAIAGDDDAATRGTAALSLDTGRNTVKVTVTAEDGNTTEAYTVTLVREAAAPSAHPAALLTASMTVGERDGFPGYNALLSPTIGAITGADFEVDSTRYELGLLGEFGATAPTPYDAETVVACFVASATPPDAVRNALVLLISGKTFRFDASTAITTSDCYAWPRPAGGLGWSYGEIVAVALELDVTPPALSLVAVSSMPTAMEDTYGVGETIRFTVTFNGPVRVTGAPHFEFSLGPSGSDVDKEAALESGDGTTALVFAYTVLAADMDDNGIWVRDHTRTVKLDAGETIRDLVSNTADAVLTHIGLGLLGGHKVDGSLTPPPPPPPPAEVPPNWGLIPSGLSEGDAFRLLIVTSTRQDAEDTAIADYNSVVQGDVSSDGHADIRSYSAGFNVLGCTETTSAIANTYTGSTDTAAAIYWLNGAKVADNYADLYDGNWDSNRPKYPGGTNAPVSGAESRVFTGCLESGASSGSNYLGADRVNQGYPASAGFEIDALPTAKTDLRRFYGLSGIFRVGAAAPTVSTVAVTSTPTAESDTYGVGELIRFTVTFTDEVEVSASRPHFEFSLDGTDTRAAYERGSGTTALVFVYTVLAADMDDNGIWIGNQTRTIKLDDGEYIRAVDDQVSAFLNHAGPGRQSEHKVDGSLTPTGHSNAIGAPAISGTARVGETLTAAIGNIADADGLPVNFPGDYSFQWIREDSDGSNAVDIPGATLSTYALVAADEGKKIKVRVSFQDDDGNDEELTSAAYPASKAVASLSVQGIHSATMEAGAPTPGAVGYSSGRVGSLNPSSFTYDGTGYTIIYLAVLGDGELSLEFDKEPPSGWTLHVDDAAFAFDDASRLRGNRDLRWANSGLTWSDGDTVNVRLTTLPAMSTNTPATGVPTISGTARVGETLTAAIGNIADADGLPDTFPDDYTLQWVRVDADGESNRVEISGASARTYTLVAADAGKRFRVRVGFTDGEGNAEARTSAATVPPPACTAGHIWCATLTVGAVQVGDQDVPHGYCDAAAGRCSTPYGGLSDTDFDLDGAPYTVESLRWDTDLVDGSGSLHLTLDRDFPAAGLGRVTLRVGSHFFAPGSATRGNRDGEDGVANNYRWTPAPAAIRGLADGAFVTVELLPNAPPVFDTGLPATLSVAENTAPDTNIGNPFTATDPDAGDTLTYTLKGDDGDNFAITDTGRIQTRAHLDHEAKISHSVTVKVSDGGASATHAVTVSVTDESDTGDDSLTPPDDDPAVARTSRATYSIRIEGDWDSGVTPGGVPPGAHFTTFVGGIHNDQVAFLEAGETASAGVEAMAEEGTTATLAGEVNAGKPDALAAVTYDAPGIAGNRTETGVVFTSDHPRITLTSMIAPTPDWFVGVSGLSLLDSSGDWLSSRTVELYPWDAGTEDGTGFDMSNAGTNPKAPIASLRGRGKFTGERIARLVFTRTGTVALAPAAPAGFAATAGDGAVTLGWTVPSASGIAGHEYRVKTTAAYGAWTAIADSAPGEANEASFTVTGLPNDTAHTFQLRAVNDVGGGVASAEQSATPVAAADTTPALESATINGAVLTLTYDVALDENSKTDAAAFTVMVAGAERALASSSAVAVAGQAVTLMLSTAAGPGESVTVSYRVPASNPVRDEDGNAAAALTDQAVINQTPGVLITPTELKVPEGGSASYTVVFATAPTATVILRVALADGGDEDITHDSEAGLTFTTSDWSTAQTVTVNAAADTDTENGTTTIAHVAIIGTYGGAPYPTVTVTEVDSANATGAPTITGTAQVGQELTAATTGIMDMDGLTNVSYTYQWIRLDADGSSNPADISGATSSTYTLVDADEGKTIKVRASFQDDDGNAESLTSAATGVVAAANNAATGAPAITGTAQVREDLTAGQGNIADTDGLPSNFPDDYTFQWSRVDADGESNSVDIGTDSSTYTLVAADVGKKIKVRVSFQDNEGNDEEVTGAAYPSGMETVAEACEVLWCATLTVGNLSTLYGYSDLPPVDIGSLSPDSFTRGTAVVGVPYVAYNSGTGGQLSLQIRRISGTTPADGLLGSEELALTLGSETFTFTAGLGSQLVFAFDAAGLSWNEGDTVKVSLAIANRPATGAPAISGTARVGETLTAAKDNIADADGLPDTFPDDYTLQWVRVDADGTNPVNIGTDSGTYALVAADVGKKIKVEVSFQDDDGNDEEVTSEPYPSGTATVGVANNPATGAPAISGTARVGETLTAAVGNIADIDELPDTFPDDYTFQWSRVDADGESNAVDIGTDSSTYALVAADVGKKIKVEISFQDDDGNDEEVTSEPYPSGTATVAAANNPATGAPAISGTARVGETLTAAKDTIADTDGLPATFPDDYTLQWVRVDADGESNSVDIGTDSSTYMLVAADEGKKIKVRVSFQDNEGNDEALTGAAYPSGMETVAEACEVLWCATLTVGNLSTLYGYSDLPPVDIGSLSPDSFTRGTAVVGVPYVAYNSGTGGQLSLQIRRISGTTPADGLLGSEELALTLGSETFTFTRRPSAASLCSHSTPPGSPGTKATG